MAPASSLNGSYSNFRKIQIPDPTLGKLYCRGCLEKVCFNKFWEPLPFWVVPGQEEGRCGGEGRVTTAGRERRGTQTEPWTQVDLAQFRPSFRPSKYKEMSNSCEFYLSFVIISPSCYIFKCLFFFSFVDNINYVFQYVLCVLCTFSILLLTISVILLSSSQLFLALRCVS